MRIKSKKTLLQLCLFITIAIVLSGQALLAQQLAFPGAEGFGAYAEGGRGGDVYYVTNTNDSGAGSLRNGIDTAAGPRTIVFAVSGLIQLQSKLNVNKDYITIAGQTAPGDGICVRDYKFNVSADHVIVRFIRSRLGDNAGQEDDAISVGGHNIIMDHCSASWSVDEVFSCSTSTAGANDNITVQWSIISEGLNNSIHSKGSHSYGALIRGCYGAKYSYHHNFWAHCSSRMPRPGNYDENPYNQDPLGLQFDFRNNVIYNWNGNRPGYDADTLSVCRMNFVGNYAMAGPNGSNGYLYDPGCKYFQGYFEGNYLGGSIPGDQYTLCNWSGFSAAEKAAWIQPVPFSTGPMVTDTALDVIDMVLDHVGASLARDSVDVRVLNDFLNGTGAIIDDEDEVGGWPAYNSTTAPTDTDLDGMPDSWETANGLNINDASDRNGYDLDPDYTNLEVYLNSLVAHLWTAGTDFNKDGKIDFRDVCILGQYWSGDESSVDVAPPPFGDNEINYEDLAVLVENWLTASTIPPLPGQASILYPPYGAVGVSTTADLSWTAGESATSHDVYFGTSSPLASQGNQTDTIFDPGTMGPATTYYWRIDSVNGWGKTEGEVWSFRTTGGGPG